MDSTTPAIIEAHGLKFPDDNSVLRRSHKRAMRRGDYEGLEQTAIAHHVQADDRVLELGAGIGFMSTFMAVKLGVKEIVTIEANPKLIPFIKKVHQLNGVAGNVDLRHGLAGITAAKAQRFYVRGNYLASSMQDNLGNKHGGVIDVSEVKTIGLDTVIPEFRPTALVCDIEGFETILLPAIDLGGLRVAVVEMHPKSTGIAGVQLVFDAFADAGMTYDCHSSQGPVVTFLRR